MIEDADHGLSEAPWQQSYTSLLVTWLTEMLFGAKIGKQVAQAQTPAAETLSAEAERPENPGGPPAAGVIVADNSCPPAAAAR